MGREAKQGAKEMDREVMLDLGRRLLVELSETLDVHVGRTFRDDIRRRENQIDAKRLRLV